MTYKTTSPVLTALAALGLATGTAQADQVFLDDVIVDGSLCVGFDCVNGESFGSDTIRLKENNLRIKFQDTSSTASFPTRDWMLLANDSTNGGVEKFSLLDVDGNRSPFTIEAGARNQSLYVENSGEVGFGTANPVTVLHAVQGNTPTLRLEQDGSSGFTPQTWDIAGNEAGFFVRDATNGSTLPFRILPGAASQSLVVDGDDEVGIGAGTNPSAPLHVKRTSSTPTGGDPHVLVENTNATVAGRTMLTLSNNGPAFLRLANTDIGADARWVFSHDGVGNLGINRDGGANEFYLEANGDLTIAGGLVTGTAGGCTAATPCDAVFDPEVYTVPSIEEHATAMWANKHLPAVGPTLPGQPVDMTQKVLTMLNELEHAHIYIEQLHARVEQLESKVY